ncbi:MAG: radical SAM protein [Candidatus Helarchaeota archaeon]
MTIEELVKNKKTKIEESPEYLQTSLAAAMTLGFRKGKFYRNAKLYCINLLLTYQQGCRAACAYCGLSRTRMIYGLECDKSFIRVEWPIYKLDEIIKAMNSERCSHVERVCISMVTNPRASKDIIIVNEQIFNETDKLISSLICPTIIDRNWLIKLKRSGTDKVGIAIDAASPELFDQLRGRGVKGPHKWEKYWEIIRESAKIFGSKNVGIHLIVGLGETEKDMALLFQKIHDFGIDIHLFSFFPEPFSALENKKQPPIGQYRRIQLLRFLIKNDLTHFEKLEFNNLNQIINFGLEPDILDKIIETGKAFMTSGCPGKTLEVACNRPYANSTPFQAYMGECRNFPFNPNVEDINIIKKQLSDYSDSYIPTIDKIPSELL